MKDGYPYEDEMVIHSKDSKDLEKHVKNNIAHVGLLIADSEPPQSVVKEVLRMV